jgi:hypothetical protein
MFVCIVAVNSIYEMTYYVCIVLWIQFIKYYSGEMHKVGP